MSKLAGKLKNSYAIDIRGKLYSWGSGDFGMLGFSSEKDIITPTKVPLEEKLSEEYFCEMVSSGQFHTGVLVNKIYEEDKKEDFEFCEELIFQFRGWLKEKIPILITSPRNLLFLLLRINENKINEMNDISLNFYYFEKYFLNGFYNYQKLHKKEYFKINKTYNYFLKNEFNVDNKKEFLISNLNKIFESDIKEFIELRNYIIEIYDYISLNPEDYSFFIKFICRFENYVTEDDIKNLFSLIKIQEKNFSRKDLITFTEKNLKNKNKKFQGKITEIPESENEDNSSCHSEKNENSIDSYEKSNCNKNLEDLANSQIQVDVEKSNYDDNNDIDFNRKNEENKNIENYEINYYDEKNEINFLFYDKKTNSLCEKIYEKFLENTTNQIENESLFFNCELNSNLNLAKNTLVNISRLVNLIVDGVDCQGMVFMWGVASEGRLGIKKEQIEINFVIEKEEKENLKSENLKKQEKVIYEDQLNKKIINNYRVSYMRKKEKNVNFYYDEDLDDEITKNKTSDLNIDEEFKVICNPVLVKFPESHTKIVKISCGFCHSLALSEEGKIYSWGLNKFNCLGRGIEEKICETPKLILIDIEGKDLYSNNSKMIDINQNSINKKYENQLIKSSNTRNANNINILPSDKKTIIDIGSGIYYSAFLTKGGEIYTWGFGANGRLGHESINSISYPKKVEFFNAKSLSTQIDSISVGDSHMSVITKSKEIFCWGSGSNGKLGNGILDDKKIPFLVKKLKYYKMAYSVCGNSNSAAVTEDNKIFVWGKNQNGMLGISKEIDGNICIPVQLDLNLNDFSIKILEINLGNSHMLIRLSNGEILTLGNNCSGVLGHSNIGEKIVIPKAISGFKAFKENKIYLPFIRQNALFKEYSQDFKLLKISISNFYNSNMKKSNDEKPSKIFKLNKINDNYQKEESLTKYNNIINNNNSEKRDSFYNEKVNFNSKKIYCKNEICLIACNEKNTIFVSFEGDLFICGDNSLIPEELIVKQSKMQNLLLMKRNTLNQLLLKNFNLENPNKYSTNQITSEINSNEISDLNFLKLNINKNTIRGSLLNNSSKNYSDMNLLRIKFQNKLQNIQEQSEDEKSKATDNLIGNESVFSNSNKNSKIYIKDFTKENEDSKNNMINSDIKRNSFSNKERSEKNKEIKIMEIEKSEVIDNIKEVENINLKNKEQPLTKNTNLLNVISKINKNNTLNMTINNTNSFPNISSSNNIINNKISSSKISSIKSSNKSLNEKISSKEESEKHIKIESINKKINNNISNNDIETKNHEPNKQSKKSKNEEYDSLDIYSIKQLYFKERITFAAIGKSHVIIISADKKLYSWGCSQYGKLGLKPEINNDGSFLFYKKPTLINSIPLPKMVCCSDTHSLVLTQTGIIYAFGSNMYGKLGIRNFDCTFDSNSFNSIPYIYEPRIIEEINDVIYITCSESHNLAIVREIKNSQMFQEVYSWGCGYSGKLGHRNILDYKFPKKIYFFNTNKTEENLNFECTTNKNNFYRTNNNQNFYGSSNYSFSLNESSSINNNLNECISPIKKYINLDNSKNNADLSKSPIKNKLENSNTIINDKSDPLNKLGVKEENIKYSNSIFSLNNNLNLNGKQEEMLETDKNNVNCEFNKKMEIKKFNFVKVCAGDEFSLFLDSLGNLWGVGRKKYLGLYEDENSINNDIILEPKILNNENSNKIKFVNSSKNFSVAIDEEGFLYGFGKLNDDHHNNNIGKHSKNIVKTKNINFYQMKIKAKNDENFEGSKFAIESGFYAKKENLSCKSFDNCFSYIALGENSFFGIAHNKENFNFNIYSWGNNYNENLGFKLLDKDNQLMYENIKENQNPNFVKIKNNNNLYKKNENYDRVMKVTKREIKSNCHSLSPFKKFKNIKLCKFDNLDYFKIFYFNTKKILESANNKINNKNEEIQESSNNYLDEFSVSNEAQKKICITDNYDLNNEIYKTNNLPIKIGLNNNFAVIKNNSILLNNYNLNINLFNKDYLSNDNSKNILSNNNLDDENRRKSLSTNNVFYFRKNGSILEKLNLLGETSLEKDTDNIIFEEQLKNDKNIKNKLQIILLEEKFENKNEGLVNEDSRIITEFNDIFGEFIFHMSNIYLSKYQLIYETENLLLLKLKSKNEKFLVNKLFLNPDIFSQKPNLEGKNIITNKNYNKNIKSCFLKIESKAFYQRFSEVSSNIPKNIAKNLQLYENLLEIVQIHPCYFLKIYSLDDMTINKKMFLNLIKNIFNVSYLNIDSNKNVENSLIGLFMAFLKFERLNIEKYILEKKIINRNSLLNDEFKNISINEMYNLLKNQKREIYDSPNKKINRANENSSNAIKNNQNNINSSENKEKLISYISNYKFFSKKLFNLIFYNSKKNLEIIYSIITELILDIVSKFLSEESVEILITTVSFKGDFLESYNKISESFKIKLTESIIGVIENSISEMFDEKKISSRKFCDSIFLILVNIIKLKNNKISRPLIFSFIFKPLLRVFGNIFLGDSYSEKYHIKNSKNKIINSILKFFKDKDNNYINNVSLSKYNRLKNLMQINEKEVKNEIFEKILSPSSKILKDIYAILKLLENNDKSQEDNFIPNNNFKNEKLINLNEIDNQNTNNANNHNQKEKLKIEFLKKQKSKIITDTDKLSYEQKLLLNNFKKNLFDKLFRRIQFYKYNFNFVLVYIKDFFQKNAKDINSTFHTQIRIFDLIFLKEFIEKYLELINISVTDPLRIVINKINLNNQKDNEKIILKKNLYTNHLVNNAENQESILISQINLDLEIFNDFHQNFLEKEKSKAHEYIEYYKNKRYARYKFPKGDVLDNVVNIKVNPYSFFYRLITKNLRNLNKFVNNFTNNANEENRGNEGAKNKILLSDESNFYSNINENNNIDLDSAKSYLIENLNNKNLTNANNMNKNINSNGFKYQIDENNFKPLNSHLKNLNSANSNKINLENFIIAKRENTKVKILKCEYCKIPLTINFFDRKIVELAQEKNDWDCFHCSKLNKAENTICCNSNCAKTKRIKNSQNFLFKKLKVPFSTTETCIFENAIYNLPTLNAEENIFKACLIELQKSKEENCYIDPDKKEALEKFVNLIQKKIGVNAIEFVDNPVSDLNNYINELNFNSAKNYESREKHRIYLGKIREIINFMRQILNVSNNFLENFKEQNFIYSNYIVSEKFIVDEKIAKIRNGNFTILNLIENNKNRRISNLTAAIRKRSLNLNINISNKINDSTLPYNSVSIKNKFSISKLFKHKVIENVNYTGNKLKEFLNKTYLSIEKTDIGFIIRIIYNATKNNLLFTCFGNNNEYIIDEFNISYLEMIEFRRLCSFNSFFTRSDIQFNLFYLVYLLNGM